MKRNKTKASVIVVRIILILLLVILGADYYLYRNNQTPVQSSSEKVIFEVKNGDTMHTVADRLADAGLVRDAKLTYYYCRVQKYSALIAGTFELNKNMSLDEIMAVLEDGSNAIQNSVQVTIIPGDWAKHIAGKIADVTNVSAEDLLNLWCNHEYLVTLQAKYPFLTDDIFKYGIRIPLEGYLAPDTYTFDPDATAQEITEKILDQTLVVYNTYADAIAQSGHSISDIYTMASILQYEASTDMENMKLISGVFYNRLAIDMPLQSSTTVCYAIDFDQNVDDWQACEVNPDFDSPYNTYLYPGLPVGPIENPDTSAIEAALYPTDSDYYFFMADVSTGQIYYAKTLEEHNANVAAHMNLNG